MCRDGPKTHVCIARVGTEAHFAAPPHAAVLSGEYPLIIDQQTTASIEVRDSEDLSGTHGKEGRIKSSIIDRSAHSDIATHIFDRTDPTAGIHSRRFGGRARRLTVRAWGGFGWTSVSKLNPIARRKRVAAEGSYAPGKCEETGGDEDPGASHARYIRKEDANTASSGRLMFRRDHSCFLEARVQMEHLDSPWSIRGSIGWG